MAQKYEMTFAAGTGIAISVAPQADGTVLVTVTNTGAVAGPAFDSFAPGTLAGGSAQPLPGVPVGYAEIAPATGQWVPFYAPGG